MKLKLCDLCKDDLIKDGNVKKVVLKCEVENDDAIFVKVKKTYTDENLYDIEIFNSTQRVLYYDVGPIKVRGNIDKGVKQIIKKESK